MLARRLVGLPAQGGVVAAWGDQGGREEGGKQAVSLALFFPLPSRTPLPQPGLQSPSHARGRGQVGTYLSRVCYRSSVHQTRHSPPHRPRLVWLTTSAGSPSVKTSGTACRASVPHASTGRAPCAAPRRAGIFFRRVVGVFVKSKIVIGAGFGRRSVLNWNESFGVLNSVRCPKRYIPTK